MSDSDFSDEELNQSDDLGFKSIMKKKVYVPGGRGKFNTKKTVCYSDSSSEESDFEVNQSSSEDEDEYDFSIPSTSHFMKEEENEENDKPDDILSGLKLKPFNSGFSQLNAEATDFKPFSELFEKAAKMRAVEEIAHEEWYYPIDLTYRIVSEEEQARNVAKAKKRPLKFPKQEIVSELTAEERLNIVNPILAHPSSKKQAPPKNILNPLIIKKVVDKDEELKKRVEKKIRKAEKAARKKQKESDIANGIDPTIRFVEVTQKPLKPQPKPQPVVEKLAPRKKFVMCKSILENKPCRYKNTCNFAHHENELSITGCQFAERCKKQKECRFFHPDETRTEYCKRISELPAFIKPVFIPDKTVNYEDFKKYKSGKNNDSFNK